MSLDAAEPRAAWLSERLLLVSTAPGGEGETILVDQEATSYPLDVDRFEVPPAVGTGPATISICRVPPSFVRQDSGDLAVTVDGERFDLHSGGPSASPTDLTTILRAQLAGLDESTRAALLGFVVGVAGDDLYRPGGMLLAQKLALIRDVLRERLPYCTVREDQPLGLHVDEIHALDERTFWIKGWVWDVDAPLATLTFMSPEGCSVEVLDAAFRYRRRDIEELYGVSNGHRPDSGFLVCVQLDAPSRLPGGWIAQLRNVLGMAVEVDAPAVTRDPNVARDSIVRDFGTIKQGRERLVVDHVQPAIASLQSSIAAGATVERVDQYGTPPADPGVTIVIPLSGSPDALEHQLIALWRDPDVMSSDVIYVIEAREAMYHLVPKAAELQWLYGLPFRLVTLAQRAGPAAMATVGASLAVAPHVLFLSPDVMPDSPGWLGALLAFKADVTDAGAIAPMLLYEDGSVQHAGISFDRASSQEMRLQERPEHDLWEPRFPFKGLPPDFAGVGDARAVPAVSNACMLVERELFNQVGGFRNLFLGEDFEAVDLCLRLSEAGRTNWYVPTARLHYLEGRSRHRISGVATQYDVIAQSQMWGEHIAALSAG